LSREAFFASRRVRDCIAQVIREFPPLCIDAVFFDEYAATDRLWLLSKQHLRHLCAVSQDQLAAELGKLSAEPLPVAIFQQHWSAMAARKRMAKLLNSESFWEEVDQRLDDY